jgi:PleD family two-component response regulator
MNLPGRKAKLAIGGLLLNLGFSLWAGANFSLAAGFWPGAGMLAALAGMVLIAAGLIPPRTRIAPPGLESAEPGSSREMAKAKRILIIEEQGREPFSEISDILRTAGYECRRLNSTFRVSEVIQIFQPHLLITEILMPGMDGLGLIQLIKKEWKVDLPVIVVSSSRGKYYINQAFELGIEDYIFKPFETEDLLARIKWVLDKT